MLGREGYLSAFFHIDTIHFLKKNALAGLRHILPAQVCGGFFHIKKEAFYG